MVDDADDDDADDDLVCGYLTFSQSTSRMLGRTEKELNL